MRGMTTWLRMTFYFLATMIKLSRPDGLKTIAAENIALRQQLFSNKFPKKPGPKEPNNEHRTHMALQGCCPKYIGNEQDINVIAMNNFRWRSPCRGLFQLPSAA